MLSESQLCRKFESIYNLVTNQTRKTGLCATFPGSFEHGRDAEFQRSADSGEKYRRDEFFGEVLHSVFKMSGKGHHQFLGLDLAVVAHHEISGVRCFVEKAVVGTVRVTDA